MKISPHCPDTIQSDTRYFCQVLQAERVGNEEEICSICFSLYREREADPDFNKAFLFAAEAHRSQYRKGTKIPYLIHLIRTWAYVRQMTSDHSDWIAALLHDVLEDTPTDIDTLEEKFGRRISLLVAGESEHKRHDRAAGETWQLRKSETIERIRQLTGQADSASAMCITFGDKLANLYSMAYEYRQVGDVLWNKFNQKDKAMQKWYYGEMGELFASYFAEKEPVLLAEYRKYYKEIFGNDEV